MAKILLVDDERDVVTLIKFLLVKDGHAVQEAYNGAQALTAIGIGPAAPAAGPLDAPADLPDLIIMDVLMPVLDGQATCMRLAAHPDACKVPVLILTAKGSAQDLFRDLPNVKGRIDKPFDPKELREKVSSMLAGKP